MATELHDKRYEGWDNFQEIKMQDLKTLDFCLLGITIQLVKDSLMIA